MAQIFRQPIGSNYQKQKRSEIGGQGRNRTTDTRIFSPLLYRLSYLAGNFGSARGAVFNLRRGQKSIAAGGMHGWRAATPFDEFQPSDSVGT